jgi:Mg2+ and Co2+ transporter CorA
VLDSIVDGYLQIMEAIEDEVLAMEQRALSAFLGSRRSGAGFLLDHEARLLTKPYHEREVVRRIEVMLARAARTG